MSLSRFREIVGVSRTTAYEWRKLGWLKVSTGKGRHPFVTSQQAAEFKARFANEEFSETKI
jgi:predicted site-specific integrase-resolvase